MSDTMGTLSFDKLLALSLKDYNTKAKIFEIEKKYFYKPENNPLSMNYMNEYLSIPIGPAAGPHTQLSQNILSAYLMGSRYFELKTVQVIDGKELQEMVSKPCIDVRNVGYNVEWSTELTVEEAKEEYIKASILLQVMAIELNLSDCKDFIFNMSVGYDLKGITSDKISQFIDDLKDAKSTDVFQECISILRNHINCFKRFKNEDIAKISSNISNSVTLSTLHGCNPNEIVEIAFHLIKNKRLNTLIKLNPALLGYDKVRNLLDQLGYQDILIRKEDFEHDLSYEKAVEIMSQLQKAGKECGVTVGVKLVNTMPVINTRDVLPGESMYLSGKPLFPIAIGVAQKFADSFHSQIPISFSGGIDKHNIMDVLEAGIAPVTLSTLLLKPRGFINIKDLIAKIKDHNFAYGHINENALYELALTAANDKRFKNKGEGEILEDTLPTYDCFEVNCGICVDVCPNRANLKLYDEHFSSKYQIVHIENRCYECDNCHTFCTRGGFPYYKKVTVFSSPEEYHNSKNAGFYKIDNNNYQIRDEDGSEYIYDISLVHSGQKKNIEQFLETFLRDYPYLIEEGNVSYAYSR